MSDEGQDGSMDQPKHHRDKRRLMLTQILHAPVLNPAGTEVGRVEDFIVKLSDGTYPPVTGLKVRVGAQDVFIGKDVIDRLEPGGVRLNTHTIRTEAFQRRPGEVLLAADVLGRHLVDVVKGRIVQAHDPRLEGCPTLYGPRAHGQAPDAAAASPTSASSPDRRHRRRRVA